MEVIALSLAITAFVLSLFAFAAAAGAIITVIGWSRSTHRIEYKSPEETTYMRDLPAGVEDFLPSPPEALSPAAYAKKLQREAEEDLYE